MGCRAVHYKIKSTFNEFVNPHTTLRVRLTFPVNTNSTPAHSRGLKVPLVSVFVLYKVPIFKILNAELLPYTLTVFYH